MLNCKVEWEQLKLTTLAHEYPIAVETKSGGNLQHISYCTLLSSERRSYWEVKVKEYLLRYRFNEFRTERREWGNSNHTVQDSSKRFAGARPQTCTTVTPTSGPLESREPKVALDVHRCSKIDFSAMTDYTGVRNSKRRDNVFVALPNSIMLEERWDHPNSLSVKTSERPASEREKVFGPYSFVPKLSLLAKWNNYRPGWMIQPSL